MFGWLKRGPIADDPLDALARVASLAQDDPRRAARELRALGVRERGRFALGASDHDAYRAAFETLHGAVAPSSADVAVLGWEHLGDDPDLRSLLRAAEACSEPFVAVVDDGPRSRDGAAGQLEALALLGDDESVAMVLIGDLDLLLRRSFVVGITAPASVLDAAEVIGELADLAVAQGLQARTVPA
jgi:hypothetical protein